MRRLGICKVLLFLLNKVGNSLCETDSTHSFLLAFMVKASLMTATFIAHNYLLSQVLLFCQYIAAWYILCLKYGTTDYCLVQLAWPLLNKATCCVIHCSLWPGSFHPESSTLQFTITTKLITTHTYSIYS